jgi:hypothetical protein
MATPPVEQMCVTLVSDGLLAFEKMSPLLALLAPANGMILNALQQRIPWQAVQDWLDAAEHKLEKLAWDYLVARFTTGVTEAEYLRSHGMRIGASGLPEAILEIGGDGELIGPASPSQQDGGYGPGGPLEGKP